MNRTELLRSALLKRCKDLKRNELKNLLEIVERSRENLPEKYDGAKPKVKKSRCAMIFNDGNEKGKVYSSMSEAAKALGIYPMQIYVLIATGRGMFLDEKKLKE